MQQKIGGQWADDPALDCMLFFAQRIDELLFHHTTDTYRFSALSLRGLAHEFCSVYRDSLKGIINEKNLPLIIEEFNDRLQKDPLVKQILTPVYVERFEKSFKSWDVKAQFENINYIGRKLSNRVYYNAVVERLIYLIKDNKKKKDIDELAGIWVREAIDCGYNENYIYYVMKKTFFQSEVSSIEIIDCFFAHFDFRDRLFDVYIGFSNDMSAVRPLFEKIELSDNSKLVVLSPNEAPRGIKKKRQKTILKISAIKELDRYSAYELANLIASNVVESYSFFRHNGSTIKTYNQVVTEDGEIFSIQQKKLLKHRVSPLSQSASEKYADELLSALFSLPTNTRDLRRIIRIHNSAIKSESIDDSLLSLWSLAESLVEVDNKTYERNDDSEKQKKDKNDSRYKSGNVADLLVPFLKSTYISKLVQTFVDDVKHWDQHFFEEYILTNEFGENELEHAFAFLAFKSTQSARDELYSRTKMYPLLKNRVMILYEQLHNSKNLKASIASHEKRIRWHIQRIYRARNYIIHDGKSNNRLNHDLLINLHSYIDTTVSKIVELINASPYHDRISDIISEHRLEVSIMDEILDKQTKEDVSEDNAKRYLYYDHRL